MDTTKEQIVETLLTGAAEMAAKLGMDRLPKLKDVPLNWRALVEDELLMLVTSEGITLGRVNAHYGDSRTYKFETYSVNGVALLEKRYAITETGWEHMPTVTYQLDEDTIIYSGW